MGFAIAEENKEVFNKSKTVRIGFYQDPRFQKGLSDDVRKTGMDITVKHVEQIGRASCRERV